MSLWKKKYGYKNFCVYFTHLPGSPPWRNLHEILHEGSTLRPNQPCQILSQSDQGFWFCGGSNFWLSHKKEKSPLTQGLNYRSACDGASKIMGPWPWPFGVTWRHQLRDHSTRSGRLPMSGPLWPCIYLAQLWRYGRLKFFQEGSSRNRGRSSVGFSTILHWSTLGT